MENKPAEKPRLKRCTIAAWLTLCVIFAFLPELVGITFPIQSLFYLVLGWFPFLKRVIPLMTISVSGLVTALLLFILMVIVIQLLGVMIIRRLQSHNATISQKRWQVRWTFALIVLVVISFTGGFAVVGVAHQTSWFLTDDDPLISRNRSRISKRSQSKNNLKQIGLAMYQYHETFGQLPSGGSFSQSGQPQHSWASQLLPYLDQASLYNAIDFNQPWNSETNRKHFETRLQILEIPGMRYRFDNGKNDEQNAKGYQPAHYAANNQLCSINSNMTFDQISDGTANTILAGEIKSNIKPWGDPLNFRDPGLGINQSRRGFGGPFTGGAHFLFSDGSVRFVSEKIDPAVLKALSTPNGGETIGEF